MKTKLILFFALIVFLLGCNKDKEIIPDAKLETSPEGQATEALGITEAISATSYGRAWAWYNGTTASSAYQFSSRGGIVSISRLSAGSYRVIFPGMGHLYNGIVHAVAYSGNHTAQVQNWYASGTNLIANIRCFNPGGSLIDGKFVVLFYKERTRPSANSAYLWSNSSLYHYNSKGLRNTLTKIGTGTYQVNFPGILSNTRTPGEKGNIIVTPYGTVARRCQIGRWSHTSSGVNAIIYTRDINGNLADATFSVSYISDFEIGHGDWADYPDYGAYVWYDLNTTPSLPYQDTNYSYNNITVSKIGIGLYQVILPVYPYSGIKTTVMASSYGTDKSYVSVQSWHTNPVTRTTTVYIRSYAPNGSPMNISSRFTLFFYTNEMILI